MKRDAGGEAIAAVQSYIHYLQRLGVTALPVTLAAPVRPPCATVVNAACIAGARRWYLARVTQRQRWCSLEKRQGTTRTCRENRLSVRPASCWTVSSLPSA